MTELFSGIAIGLTSPAGLIISTLATLTIGLLAVRAVKAAFASKAAPARPVAVPQTAKRRKEDAAETYRRAA